MHYSPQRLSHWKDRLFKIYMNEWTNERMNELMNEWQIE